MSGDDGGASQMKPFSLGAAKKGANASAKPLGVGVAFSLGAASKGAASSKLPLRGATGKTPAAAPVGGFFEAAANTEPERIQISTIEEATQGLLKDKPLEPRVIAPLQNTFQVGAKRRAPGFVPNATEQGADDGPAFERAEAGTDNAQTTTTTYGLHKRGGADDNESKAKDEPAAAGASTDVAARAEAAAAKRARRQAGGVDEARRAYREEEAACADDTGVEEYETMPVSDFGKALLRGMGWQEGKGIGRSGSHADDVVVKDVHRRPHRLGLGADATPGAGASRGGEKGGSAPRT